MFEFYHPAVIILESQFLCLTFLDSHDEHMYGELGAKSVIPEGFHTFNDWQDGSESALRR